MPGSEDGQDEELRAGLRTESLATPINPPKAATPFGKSTVSGSYGTANITPLTARQTPLVT